MKGNMDMVVSDTGETGDIKVLRGITPQSEPGRRRWRILVLTVMIAGAALIWYALADPVAETPENAATIELQYTEVVATDLVEISEYEGTMGRLEGDPVSVRLDGTVTALPEEGATLEQGDVVGWIDNQPVVLLYGELPAWRTMGDEVEGPDVLQLETGLTALGFNESESLMTVDDSYTSATASVVETWQEAIGAEENGVVAMGAVVFKTGPVRVDALQVKVGDLIGAGSAIFTTSAEEIEISFDLPTSEQGNVEAGDAVEITLPDLSTTTGVVAEVATVANLSEDANEPSFEVIVVLDDPSVADGIDEAPVTVAVITDRTDGVTAVPVEALVALAEGGYAVEVQDGSGTRLVGVEPGFYADGLVEVTGEISPGDKVVVP